MEIVLWSIFWAGHRYFTTFWENVHGFGKDQIS